MKLYILSEDSSNNSFEVLSEVVKCSLRSIEEHVDFDLLDFNKDFNECNCIKGANWKVKKPRRDFIDFINDLSYELLNENNYVFWHIDGDEKWSDKEKSENLIKFIKMKKNIKLQYPSLDPDKIFLIMPFYSIESWLYPFLKEDNLNNGEIYLYTNVNDFDEIKQIKDNSGISDKKNLLLSKQINHDLLIEYKKSYFDSYNKIINNTEFVSKIQEKKYKWIRNN